MIVLDTNVLSELMRPVPSDRIRAWLLQTRNELLVTTVITIAEIEYGIARLPTGKRRVDLEARFMELTGPQFDFAVLPFDETAARLTGHLRHERERLGLGTHFPDMMIAAMAITAHADLATRNTRDFTGIGLKVVDPWQEFATRSTRTR